MRIFYKTYVTRNGSSDVLKLYFHSPNVIRKEFIGGRSILKIKVLGADYTVAPNYAVSLESNIRKYGWGDASEVFRTSVNIYAYSYDSYYSSQPYKKGRLNLILSSIYAMIQTEDKRHFLIDVGTDYLLVSNPDYSDIRRAILSSGHKIINPDGGEDFI